MKKIAIIGLGNIGMMYDYHKTSPLHLHMQALLKIKKLDFIGAVDLSKRNLLKNFSLNRLEQQKAF